LQEKVLAVEEQLSALAQQCINKEEHLSL